MASYKLTRRGIRILGVVLLSSIGLFIYIRWHNILQAALGPRLPPLYEEVRAKEQTLLHYKEYERKSVKYFFAANHAHSKPKMLQYMTVLPTRHPFLGSGWGNVMQDFVMMGLLAHTTNRS